MDKAEVSLVGEKRQKGDFVFCEALTKDCGLFDPLNP